MIGVLIVDDNAQIRDALRSELDAHADLRVMQVLKRRARRSPEGKP